MKMEMEIVRMEKPLMNKILMKERTIMMKI